MSFTSQRWNSQLKGDSLSVINNVSWQDGCHCVPKWYGWVCDDVVRIRLWLVDRHVLAVGQAACMIGHSGGGTDMYPGTIACPPGGMGKCGMLKVLLRSSFCACVKTRRPLHTLMHVALCSTNAKFNHVTVQLQSPIPRPLKVHRVRGDFDNAQPSPAGGTASMTQHR